MASRIALIAGLGNPGEGHARDRHNAGFWFVDSLARAAGQQFRPESKFHGEVCRLPGADDQVWLLKPQTYMNHSGQSVAALARFYKLPLEAILVVHDELDLPPGTVRLKRGGGHGGHNGLRDIAAHLGSKDFLRLRIGIGHPGESRLVTNYVLRDPPAEERELIEAAIDDAREVLPGVLDGELQKAMNALHARKP